MLLHQPSKYQAEAADLYVMHCAPDLEQIKHIRSAEYPECCSPQPAAFVWLWLRCLCLNEGEGYPGRTESVSYRKVTRPLVPRNKRDTNQLEIQF